MAENQITENQIGGILIGCAINVHTALGPGLLESCYEACLQYDLLKMGLVVERQRVLPVNYRGIEIDAGYRIDLLIERKVVVELKVVDEVNNVHKAQLLTYLKLGNFKLGYILNFNKDQMRKGIYRVVNGLESND